MPKAYPIDKDAWEKFLSGCWTKKTPTRVGRYPLVSVHCDGPSFPAAHMLTVAEFDFQKSKVLRYSVDWHPSTSAPPEDYWYWSAPMPDLPRPPNS